MNLKEIFLGKPLHWILWLGIVVVLFWAGAQTLHVKSFVPFLLILLALAGGSVAVILMGYKRGERITREPFEEE